MSQFQPELIIAPLITILCIFLNNFILKTGILGNITGKMNLSSIDVYFFSKVLGGSIFGAIPYMFIVSFPGRNPEVFGITAGRLGDMRITVIMSALLVVLVSYKLASSYKFRERMLKVEKGQLTIRTSLLLASGWIVYIFGYELLFRGILWFTFFNAFGFLPALLVNLALYAFAHYRMGRMAILGSIPVGIIFCYLSYLTGTFLFAFILHSIMSSTFEIFSLYRLSAGKLTTER